MSHPIGIWPRRPIATFLTESAQIFAKGDLWRTLAASTLRKLFATANAKPTMRICANVAYGSPALTQGAVTVSAIHATKVERTQFERLYRVPNHGSRRLKSRSSNGPRNAIQQTAKGLPSEETKRAASRGAVSK